MIRNIEINYIRIDWDGTKLKFISELESVLGSLKLGDSTSESDILEIYNNSDEHEGCIDGRAMSIKSGGSVLIDTSARKIVCVSYSPDDSELYWNVVEPGLNVFLTDVNNPEPIITGREVIEFISTVDNPFSDNDAIK